MKKALIVILILAMAGGLFAQTWTGSVNTGAKITFTDDDIPVMATRNGDDDAAVDASLSFTNGDDTWGITVGASAKVDTEAAVTGLDIGDMVGWVKFADMFKLTAGKGVGGAWGSGGNTDTNISDSVAGVRLEVEPIDGLNFGVRFGYPNSGVKANKIVNFFEEIGIGAKYSADVWWAALGLDLDSEETQEVDEETGAVTGGGELDALLYFGFNYTGIELVKIHVGAKIENLFTEKTVTLFEKLNGTVAGLNWYFQANEKLIPDPLEVGLEVGVSYPITISDKTSAEVGASANASFASDPGFSFDEWNAYAQVSYKFNDNVNTSAKFNLHGDMGDDTKISAYLRWLIGFSF